MKTVLITGTSSGFGLTLVQDFLKDGYKVVATLRAAQERSNIFKELLAEYPQTLFVHELDVTKSEDRANIVKYINSELGAKLDVLINNAGYGAFGALEDFTEEEVRYQMEVNFFGPTFLTKSLLPALRASKGKVVNISSIMGQYSFTAGAVYSASKYALNGITEGLKYELNAHGVDMINIEPGGHRTNFVKSIKWGKNSFDSSSPYYKQTLGLQKMMKKLQSKGASPGADKIGQVVLKAVKNSNGPQRIVLGKDANFIAFLYKILPNFIYTKLMVKSNRMLLKES